MAMYKTLGNRQLEDAYSIEIRDAGDSWKVYFHSRWHVDKKAQVYPVFGKEFTHAQILRDPDLMKYIRRAYGVVTKPDPAPY